MPVSAPWEPDHRTLGAPAPPRDLEALAWVGRGAAGPADPGPVPRRQDEREGRALAGRAWGLGAGESGGLPDASRTGRLAYPGPGGAAGGAGVRVLVPDRGLSARAPARRAPGRGPAGGPEPAGDRRRGGDVAASGRCGPRRRPPALAVAHDHDGDHPRPGRARDPRRRPGHARYRVPPRRHERRDAARPPGEAEPPPTESVAERRPRRCRGRSRERHGGALRP